MGCGSVVQCSFWSHPNSFKPPKMKTPLRKHNHWHTLLGVILLPILFSAFIVDRFIMVFLVVSNAPTIIEYFQDMKYIAWSLLRVFVFTITIIIVWLMMK
jgi:hypothetical protein